MTGEKARELAKKHLDDCWFETDNETARYEYNIDGLIEFVKDGILLGYALAYKQITNLEKIK